MIISIIGLIILLPLAMHIIDGSREKKIVHGILHVLKFIAVIVVSCFLIRIFGIYFVFSIPLLLLVFVFLKKVRGKY